MSSAAGSALTKPTGLVSFDDVTFAYPHGAYDKRVRQAVIDAGYVSAAAVKNAFSHPADDPYAIAAWWRIRSRVAALAATYAASVVSIVGAQWRWS